MSRQNALKKAFAQIAQEQDNHEQMNVLKNVMQNTIPHYKADEGPEQFQQHKGPVKISAWSGMKEDHNTFEDVMSGFGHSDTGYAGRGLYAASKKIASSYAEVPGRKLKQVVFEFKNPLIRTPENWQEPIMPYAWIPQRTGQLEQEGMDWTEAKKQASKEYVELLKENGYDGFIDVAYKDGVGEIVAYDGNTVEILEPKESTATNVFVKTAADESKPEQPLTTEQPMTSMQEMKLNFMKMMAEKKKAQQQTNPETPEQSQVVKPQVAKPQTQRTPEQEATYQRLQAEIAERAKAKQQTKTETPEKLPTEKPQAKPQTQRTPEQEAIYQRLQAEIAERAKAKQQTNVEPVTEQKAKPQTQRTPEQEAIYQKLQAEIAARNKAKFDEDNQELNEYVKSNPPPETLKTAAARNIAMITMPKSGTSIDAFPGVPDGAFDEFGTLVIEDVGAVSYPDGLPVFAAFGDKTEYEGMLKAAGFKPLSVYFFPKPESKKGWTQAKHAYMYAAKGLAAKEAFENALNNPAHPIAVEGRKQQDLIDNRRIESTKERNKYQENIDRIQRNAHTFTTEGYQEEAHRESYAAKPDKTTSIPTPIRLGKDPLNFLPYQMVATNFLNERLGKDDKEATDEERGAILADSPGIGKAQPVDTPVLTPKGWIPIGQIKIGDEIFAGDGSITTVTGVFPQGEKEVFRIKFTDNSSTECCDEHLWVVNTPYRIKKKLQPKTKSLLEIKEEGLMASGKRKHYIPITAAVQFREKELSVDPYVLGCILGDGSITQKQILFSTRDEEILHEIKQRIPEGIVINSVDDRGCNFRLASTSRPNVLTSQLKQIGIWGLNSDNKHIPEEYLFAHTSARMELLQGLMDTDGTVLKHNSTQFTSNSEQLINNVAFLVESLGGICRLTSKISASGKTHHIATIKMSKCPFKLSRKVEIWRPHLKYTEKRAIKDIIYSRMSECVCISVAHESRTYLTERCIVTHNTMSAIAVINTNPSIKKVLVVCPSVMVPVWIEEMKKWLAGKHVRHPITDKLTVSIGRYSKTDDLPDITVMSYESLRLAAKELANPERIGGKSWDYVILDESHRVKDEHSVQACVIMGGRPKRRKTENPLVPDLKTPGNDNIEYPGIPSKRRLLLTGTPIPSYAWELYANLHFIRPDIFNDEDEFMYQFADMKAFNSTIWKKNRVSGAPELHRLFITKPVKPKNMTLMNKILFGGGTYNSKGGKKHFKGLVMRRVHKDLETLGDKYTWPPRGKPKYLAITEPQDQKGLDAKTEELSQMEQRIQAAIQRNASPDELAELEHEYNEKVKVSFQRVAKVRNAIGMKKAPYVANEAVIQASGEQEGKPNQVLVFAYHKNVIETIATSIQAQFEKQGHPEWKVAVVYGATSDKKREETFKQFQTDPNVKVIVASYKVLKEGITLTAANKVIHAELMPNPIDYEQSYARAWRRGQQRTVDETYMWLPRSFDQRLYNIASGKFAAANRILNYRLPEEQETKPETN